MPKRVKSDETASRTMSIMPTAAFIRPEKRNATFSDEAICAGLVGAANLKIAAPTGGRGNRPYQKDEYRWAKKRRALTRQKQQKQNASHRIAITVQQLLIRLTDYPELHEKLEINFGIIRAESSRFDNVEFDFEEYERNQQSAAGGLPSAWSSFRLSCLQAWRFSDSEVRA